MATGVKVHGKIETGCILKGKEKLRQVRTAGSCDEGIPLFPEERLVPVRKMSVFHRPTQIADRESTRKTHSLPNSFIHSVGHFNSR